MSNDINDQISACADLLQTAGVEPDQIEYFKEFAHDAAQKLIGALSAKWVDILETAEENGKEEDETKSVKLSFAVEVDVSEPAIIKGNTVLSFTNTKKYKVESAIGREIGEPREPQLGLGEGEQP